MSDELPRMGLGRPLAGGRFGKGLLPLIRLCFFLATLFPSSLCAQISLGVSKHIGFDQSLVGSTSQMLSWWNDSPYFDAAVYPNGAASHQNDPNLDSAWVSAVHGYGWGLIPAWAGEQAPCACKPNTGQYPDCTLFEHTFDWNPQTAQAEGKVEADAAAEALGPNQLFGLGLTGTIAYFDIEKYTAAAVCNSDNTNSACPSSGTCADAVTAFLSGWVSGLHSDGLKAGIYGSPIDAYDVIDDNSDWTDVASLDDVWLAFIPYTKHHKVTVWNVVQPSQYPQ
jgi:hypothetical protein